MERQRLIDQKHEVQGRIRTLRPRVERARREAVTKRDLRRVAKLEVELEQLMATEMRLRLAIDRSQ